MWGYGWTWPMMLWMGIGTIFWLGVLALLIWAVVRWVGPRATGRYPTASGMSAMEILRQRYARGEIDAATFEQMRERLESTAPSPGEASTPRFPGAAPG